MLLTNNGFESNRAVFTGRNYKIIHSPKLARKRERVKRKNEVLRGCAVAMMTI
jgi:hypothetical protein